VGEEGSGLDESKELLATGPRYAGIDRGSDCGPEELRALIALIVLAV